jgi:hypothetical protein
MQRNFPARGRQTSTTATRFAINPALANLGTELYPLALQIVASVKSGKLFK